ncbi:putative oxidoreductase YteT isoform X1 [Haliotis asinina]|uniref:putative oxidoreductase YteT isoform X1 n=1 Tax=Haliotis asinina TaxID=109174 RepID=UPI003531D46E
MSKIINMLRKKNPEQQTGAVTCIVVGAGSRGSTYAAYAQYYPDRMKVVGLAEPREYQRNEMKEKNEVPACNVFTDWREAVKRDKFADFVIITTVDRDHKDPAIAFAKKGYHILLEKPMAVTEADCREIVSTCKQYNVTLTVCHVLRYVPWAKKIKEVITSGRIGDVVNIQHTEPVGFWHFPHSFVRGNWRNEEESSNCLLAKCCHDVDLIKCWMGEKKCQRISSFGNLSHFRKEDKPEGAASRCMDCPQKIETSCPYSAKRLYLDEVKSGNQGWPVSIIADVPDIESVTEALKTGPYGRCVYECDNDVMSHQVVNFQFEGGATASLTMVAFTKKVCQREVKVYGTRGEISMVDDGIKVFDFLTGQTTTEHLEEEFAQRWGHGGADYHLIHTFVTAMRENNPELIETGADDTLNSHLLVFAAEKARKENCVVTINPDGTF